MNIEEALLHERFEDTDDIESLLISCFGKVDYIGANQSWKNEEKDDYDYLIVAEVETNGMFYDIDIYYTKSKNHYFITEVNVETA